MPGSLSLGVKRSGHEADHSPPSSGEVKESVEPYLHFPKYAFVAWCSVKKESTETTMSLPYPTSSSKGARNDTSRTGKVRVCLDSKTLPIRCSTNAGLGFLKRQRRGTMFCFCIEEKKCSSLNKKVPTSLFCFFYPSHKQSDEYCAT
jgi:hypothetical protein